MEQNEFIDEQAIFTEQINTRFTMYTIIREAFVNHYLENQLDESTFVSEEDFEKNYHIILQKEEEHESYTPSSLEEEAALSQIRAVKSYTVIRKQDMDIVDPIKFFAIKSINKNIYIISPIPDFELFHSKPPILFTDNLNHNTDVINVLISLEISRQMDINPNIEEKEIRDKICKNLDAFEQSFKRHINYVLGIIIGHKNSLNLLKSKNSFQFTWSDRSFLEFIYDTYETEGKFFYKEQYEHVSDQYVKTLFIGICQLTHNYNIPVNMNEIENKFNKILLKIEKIKLQKDFQQLSKALDWMMNIPEDDHLITKIQFIRKNRQKMIDCYKEIYENTKKTFQ